MFVLGIALGMVVLFTDVRRPVEVRRRAMSDAEAVGYRAAFGEDPMTMQIRDDRP